MNEVKDIYDILHVGDKIRCIEQTADSPRFNPGDICTVAVLDRQGVIRVEESKSSYWSRHFELLETAQQIKSKEIEGILNYKKILRDNERLLEL